MAKPSPQKSGSSRVRKLDYKSKKKVARTKYLIPGGLKTFIKAIGHIWKNKKLFGGLMAVNIVLYFVLVKGFANNFQLGEAKQTIESAVGDQIGTFGTAAALIGFLVGNSTKATGESAVYQLLIFIIMSLAYIWALRQTYEVKTKQKVRVKQVFYSSTFPLVQYILVWGVILIQLLPALAGVTIYSIVINNGIAVNTFEQILWLIMLITLIGWSLFMISSSIFATYIVTLPEMTPMLSLKKSKAIVKFRRFLIVRRVFLLPVVLITITAIIFIPLVIYLPVVAEILFVIFMVKVILVSHSYLYILYKEMLKNE